MLTKLLKNTRTTCHLIINQQLFNQVERLWEIVQIPDTKGARSLDTGNVCEQRMTELSSEELHSDPPTYYLPHHAVMKPVSTTTKIRVIFDGSSKTQLRRMNYIQ